MAYGYGRRKRRAQTCKFCWESGHTKRTCPDRKKEIENLRKNYGDDHWKVEEYDKSRIRKCSFCKGPNHTKRTCDDYKIHMEKQKTECKNFRTKLKQELDAIGLGVGSIVKGIKAWRKIATVDGGLDWEEGNPLCVVKTFNATLSHYTDMRDAVITLEVLEEPYRADRNKQVISMWRLPLPYTFYYDNGRAPGKEPDESQLKWFKSRKPIEIISRLDHVEVFKNFLDPEIKIKRWYSDKTFKSMEYHYGDYWNKHLLV